MQIPLEIGPIRRDWFDYMNTIIGLGGLFLTVWAIIVAGGARKAAKEAKDAVYRRNASEDIERLRLIAASLLTSIETEQYDLASHQARDFISCCMNVREHHRLLLGKNGGKLEVAFQMAREISKSLQFGLNLEDANAVLVENTQRLVGDVSTLSGILKREVDQEGQ